MIKNIKILCTIGPKSLNKNVISFFLKNKVDLFRINMSHTSIKDLEKNIKYLQKLYLKIKIDFYLKLFGLIENI